MIGGTDIQIKTQAGTDGLDVALRLAKHLWPNAIIEDAATGERTRDIWGLALDRAPELLVYRDEETSTQWDQHGAIPELNGTLIHLLLDESVLTVTLDNVPNQQLLQYVKATQDALRQSIFNVTASRKAAA